MTIDTKAMQFKLRFLGTLTNDLQMLGSRSINAMHFTSASDHHSSFVDVKSERLGPMVIFVLQIESCQKRRKFECLAKPHLVNFLSLTFTKIINCIAMTLLLT